MTSEQGFTAATVTALADRIHRDQVVKEWYPFCTRCGGTGQIDNGDPWAEGPMPPPVTCPACAGRRSRPGLGDDANLVFAKMMLVVSEVAEAAEAYRKDRTKPDKHCPQHTGLAVEIADGIIRALDLAVLVGVPDIGRVVLDKLAYNRTRPPRHGNLPV